MTSPTEEIGQSIQTGNFLTNYHDVGTGKPVLLIHGSGPGVSAWANWRRTIPALADACRVIAPDMAGFGFTEVVATTQYTVKTWTRQLVDLLDGLGIEHVDVVGNSFGGAMAMALAIEHPDRVNKLALMGSVGLSFPISTGLDKVWGYEPSVQNMGELVDLFAYDKSIVTPELIELRYRASIRPGSCQAYADMFPAPRQRWLDALARTDEALRNLHKPCLLLHGRDDQIIPVASSYRLLELLPSAQLHVFGNCGHWVQIEKAADFNHVLKDFLCGGFYG